MTHTGPMPLDLAFSFDTTGSMGSVIDQVRANIAEMLARLSADIPDIRVAVIAHGDYGDVYETQIRDFGTPIADLVDFVKTVRATHGSDEPECYELVLQQARTRLAWRQGSSRALVLVGDAFPHDVGSVRNKYKIDWKAEVQLLRQLGVTAYCVQCRSAGKVTEFMDHVAQTTGGLRLPLAEFRGVRDFLMAIAYREGGTDALQSVYEREVREREGAALPGDLGAMLGLVRRASDRAGARTKTVSLDSTRKTKAVSFDDTRKAASRSKKAARAAAMTKLPAAKKAKKTLAAASKAGIKLPKTKTRKLSSVRVRRESCSGKNLPASLAHLAWSPWRLVGRPGSLGASRLSWQPFGSGSVRRSLVSARSSSGAHVVELAVQPRPGARRCPLFGRVLSIRDAPGRGGPSITVGRLLSGRPTVRAQLLRVLWQGMRVHARVACSPAATAPSGLKLRPGLLKAASYAWNSGRSVRCGGAFVSVSERSLQQ